MKSMVGDFKNSVSYLNNLLSTAGQNIKEHQNVMKETTRIKQKVDKQSEVK